MVHQETEGLLSPFIRDIRLRKVASCINNSTTILDIGCGEGYLQQFLPSDCSYYGVDRIPPSSAASFSDFIVLDLLEEKSLKHLKKWLPRKPDYITCNAFLEHITNPGDFVSMYSRLLAKNGKFIGTTPHPRGRSIHQFVSSMYFCSRHGAEEHEQFLGREEIENIAVNSGGAISFCHQFLFGLNQIFVIEYPNNDRY